VPFMLEKTLKKSSFFVNSMPMLTLCSYRGDFYVSSPCNLTYVSIFYTRLLYSLSIIALKLISDALLIMLMGDLMPNCRFK